MSPGPSRITIPHMAFWTDIFTLETWAQAEKERFSVSGFPAPTKTKGGYSARYVRARLAGGHPPLLLQGPGCPLGGSASGYG